MKWNIEFEATQDVANMAFLLIRKMVQIDEETVILKKIDSE